MARALRELKTKMDIINTLLSTSTDISEIREEMAKGTDEEKNEKIKTVLNGVWQASLHAGRGRETLLFMDTVLNLKDSSKKAGVFCKLVDFCNEVNKKWAAEKRVYKTRGVEVPNIEHVFIDLD